MRALYKHHAHNARITFHREYTPGDHTNTDPVNQALTAGNTALYGIVGAALASLGIHPGLGIIHTGHRESLTYDFADLYKADITIPLAFNLKNDPTPDRTIRRHMRERLTLLRLLPRIIRDIYDVYAIPTPNDETDAHYDLVNLWDNATTVPSATNYSPTAPPGW